MNFTTICFLIFNFFLFWKTFFYPRHLPTPTAHTHDPRPLPTTHDPRHLGRDPFNQNFRKFRSKTQWIGSVQAEKFRKNRSTFWGGPLFPVGPVWILVEWIAPLATLNGIGNVASYWVSSWDSWLLLSYLSWILRVFLVAKIVRLRG